MVAVATAIAVLDVFFILVAVPESLPAQQPKKDGSKPAPARALTLEQVDDLIDLINIPNSLSLSIGMVIEVGKMLKIKIHSGRT